MDEVRCPMCGNPNPSELEECQYCQARLKPLIMSQPPEAEPVEGEGMPPASDQGEGLPDWLQDLRMEDEKVSVQEIAEIESDTPFEEEGDADWLARLRDQSPTGDEVGEAKEPEAEPFVEEFLQNQLDGTEPDIESLTDDEVLIPDIQEADITWPAGLEPSDEDELPEWLSEISPVAEPSGQSDGEFDVSEKETPSHDEEQVPDRQEADTAWPAGLEPSDEDELPEWLSEINPAAESSDQSEGELDVTEYEAPSHEEELMPDRQEADTAWPAGMEPSDEDELPEWLSEISPVVESSDQSVGELEVPEHESLTQEESLPEWMVESEPVEPQDHIDQIPEAGIKAQELEAEEVDDEGQPESDDEEVEEEPAEQAVEEEQPEWLKGLEADQTERVSPFEDQAGLEAGEPEIVEGELPDWLVDLKTDETEEEEVEELPDWLAASENETDTEAEEVLPEWLAPTESVEVVVETLEDEAPEWMADLEAEEIESTVDTPVEEIAEEFEEEIPEWLTEMEQESVSAFAIAEEDEEGVTDEAPLLSDDEEGEEILESLPEWAEDVSLDEEVEEFEESELEEAQLPSWLEAMRPVETLAPDMPVIETVEEQVETSGPLAGLSGILAAESDFARVRKPPAYSVKLRVTENQQARVTLLREMLSTEAKQKTLPAQPVITPQYIFRLVIALALILPILWAVISGGTLTPLPEPASASPGVLDVRTQIDSQVSINSPVLVAFDYEAGYSPELDISASAVISHLMEKEAYITLVSTSPSGPILAERLIKRLNQTSIRQENPFTSYSNMGYVPGGTTGLLSLAQTPRETIPYSLDNIVVWESSPLNLVSTVADFSMIMVITENPDTARAWVEQVQPFLQINETPLIMIVSAQAEPLVRPYYDGSPKQVNGLIVGVPGGAAYESVTRQGGMARRSWDAFSLSMLVAELILVIGAVAGLGTMLLNSTKKEED